jgi:DNA-binding LacI/PurR family transcriptional regulator
MHTQQGYSAIQDIHAMLCQEVGNGPSPPWSTLPSSPVCQVTPALLNILLVAATTSAWASEEEQVYIEGCNLAAVPQCYIGDAPGKSLCTAPDLIKAGRETARLFAGHRVQRAGFVGKFGKPSPLLNGFQEGCKEYGLKLEPENIFFQQAQPSGGTLAAEEVLLLAEKPDAMLFESGLAATGALSAWNKGGIKIPEQLKIVACGSPALLEYLSPSVTAVTFPVEAMAEDALTALLSSIGGNRIQMHKTYEPEFVFRESCGPFPGKKAYRIFI